MVRRPDAPAGLRRRSRHPDMTLPEALAKGCRTLVIGVVNAGGVLPDHWVKEIVAAIEAGLDVASGLHVKLGTIPAIAEAAARRNRQLHDVRHTDERFPPARAPSGRAGACSPSAPTAPSARSTRARPGARHARARPRRRFLRHRPDRRVHLGRGRASHRRRGGRLHLRRRRDDLAGGGLQPLGPDRGPGLALPRPSRG